MVKLHIIDIESTQIIKEFGSKGNLIPICKFGQHMRHSQVSQQLQILINYFLIFKLLQRRKLFDWEATTLNYKNSWWVGQENQRNNLTRALIQPYVKSALHHAKDTLIFYPPKKKKLLQRKQKHPLGFKHQRAQCRYNTVSFQLSLTSWKKVPQC